MDLHSSEARIKRLGFRHLLEQTQGIHQMTQQSLVNCLCRCKFAWNRGLKGRKTGVVLRLFSV